MISPLALVDAAAEIGPDVRIGPYAIVAAGAKIGAGAELAAHVMVHGCVTVGAGCVIGAFTALGGPPQDTSYRGEPTRVSIGAGAVMHEHVTVHRGTARGRGETLVGEGCLLMSQSHVGHDSLIEHNVTIAQGAVAGGHVHIGAFANLGGLCAVHQHGRIGRGAFVGGLAAVVQDVIPYGMAVGNHARLAGLNVVGMKRRGFSRAEIHAVRAAYRQLFHGEGLFSDRLRAVREAFAGVAPVEDIVAFIEADARRPVCMPSVRAG